MNGWTLTKVWEVNRKLVVAKTIEEAIELYRKYSSKDVDIESVISVNGSSSGFRNDAIIMED